MTAQRVAFIALGVCFVYNLILDIVRPIVRALILG